MTLQQNYNKSSSLMHTRMHISNKYDSILLEGVACNVALRTAYVADRQRIKLHPRSFTNCLL